MQEITIKINQDIGMVVS